MGKKIITSLSIKGKGKEKGEKGKEKEGKRKKGKEKEGKKRREKKKGEEERIRKNEGKRCFGSHRKISKTFLGKKS